MKTPPFALLALALVGCGAHRSCPPVDETAMARAIVDEVFRRLDPDAQEPAVEPADEEEPVGDRDPFDHVPFDDLPCRGDREARVRVLVASDFQCPFCGRYTETLDRLVERYEDDVVLCFVNYPLPFHEHARMAAEAAVEAREQQGDEAFFRMHDRMFAHQTALSIDDLVRYAREIGLDADRMRSALLDHRHASEVDDDVQLADELGVGGTPTTFVEGETISGAVPFSTLDAAVRRALDRR